MTRLSTKADRRRDDLREEFWPHQRDLVWGGPTEKGYWCAPRVTPLLLGLARSKKIVGELDCSGVYLELCSRDFGQGIVEILDEEEHAYYSGYIGKRARRSWQERIRRLEGAEFIRVQPKGNRPIGYILIVHPYKVAADLRSSGKIDDSWWILFTQRVRDLGGGEALSRFLHQGNDSPASSGEAKEEGNEASAISI
jgi:hypothetical protein